MHASSLRRSATLNRLGWLLRSLRSTLGSPLEPLDWSPSERNVA
jgi:hypothetical protein